MCGRYGPHTSNIKRHIRNCRNCKYKLLDNPLVACTMIDTKKMHDIAQSNNGALRKEWSQHRVDNAFNYVTFADSKHGIFGATPRLQSIPLLEENRWLFLEGDLFLPFACCLDRLFKHPGNGIIMMQSGDASQGWENGSILSLNCSGQLMDRFGG